MHYLYLCLLITTRTIMEIKESENRARMQAEYLRTVLDEHNLELRVKAANEAEAACQQRLSAAEAEIADLRAKLDSSERWTSSLPIFSPWRLVFMWIVFAHKSIYCHLRSFLFVFSNTCTFFLQNLNIYVFRILISYIYILFHT